MHSKQLLLLAISSDMYTRFDKTTVPQYIHIHICTYSTYCTLCVLHVHVPVRVCGMWYVYVCARVLMWVVACWYALCLCLYTCACVCYVFVCLCACIVCVVCDEDCFSHIRREVVHSCMV